jgi:hypothetical protein
MSRALCLSRVQKKEVKQFVKGLAEVRRLQIWLCQRAP